MGNKHRHNYNNYSQKKPESKNIEPELKVEEIEEHVAEIEGESEEKTSVFGRVDNCLKLNIRAKPNSNAEVLIVALRGTLLKIDEEQSTENWYSVCTESGREGFCMKQFVSIKEPKVV